MKTRKILTALLAIGLLFTLAACSGNKDAAENLPLSGKYVITDIKDDPDGTTFKELEAMYKEQDLNLTDHLYLEFSAGNSFVLVMFGETEAAGTYTLDNNTLTLTVGEGTQTATMSGSKITWEYENGAKLIFKNQQSGLLGIGGFNWLWVLLGVFVVAAIGGGGAFIIIRKKEKVKNKNISEGEQK